MLGTPDTQVLDKAFAEDRIVVTCNIDDFVDLAGQRDLHAGVILIEQGSLRREAQLDLLRKAITAIEQHGDLINQVLRIAVDGTMSFEDSPTE
jgi:predicted nuclease of predicted toxin-antitoxin system